MADDDASEKTEEPTSKRLADARQKGQVAQSREINNFMVLLAATLTLLLFVPNMAGDLVRKMVRFIDHPHQFLVDGEGFILVLRDLVYDVVGLLMLPIGFLALAGFLASYLQNGLMFSPEALKPNPSKLSPINGAKKMFSVNSVTELLKGIVKLCVVGAVAFAVVVPELHGLDSLFSLSPVALPRRLEEIVLPLMGAVVGVMAVLAVLDLVYQRHRHIKQLRMSKQEVKDEGRQSEGDPQVKARLRSIRQERANRRMMAEVPNADVVVTNPTHYAVALKYDADEMTAPRVVAKGQDVLAARIRDVAKEHDVPVVENPPLARALHAGVELDQEIPEKHYKAVAEIISYIWRLKGRRTAEQAT